MRSSPELRSCVNEEVDVLSLIVHTISANAKANLNERVLL